ncbi:hypothetical protein HPB50_008370 [Hyalomma asiaticum]|uniref:Uncharacterized protein n=1 Tax=Hyalomma asiaticum TaxID=266040 RepID=A0ACB7TEM0_HYAAI|nr:hypothetical protein HPB50_008370 [Hyalomma asiaticum]
MRFGSLIVRASHPIPEPWFSDCVRQRFRYTRGATKLVCTTQKQQKKFSGGGASRPEAARKASGGGTLVASAVGEGGGLKRGAAIGGAIGLRFRSGAQNNVQARDDEQAGDDAARAASAAPPVRALGLGAGRPVAGVRHPAACSLHRDGSDRGLPLLGPGDRVSLLR